MFFILNLFSIFYESYYKFLFKVYKAKIGTNKLGVGKISIYKDSIGIGTKDGEILLLEIQPMGKKKMDIKSYLNGINKEEFIKRKVE